MSDPDGESPARSDASGSTAGLPGTAEMMADLDRVQETIPRLLESLSSALGTLLERDTELGREDKWEEHLKGFSGQYYGRLNEVQLTLRSTLRTLRTLNRSPYALQPPNPSALRASFSPSGPPAADAAGAGADEDEDDLFEDPEELAARDAQRVKAAQEEASRLSLYAVRLELRALRELRDSLRGMRAQKEGRAQVPAEGPKVDGQSELLSTDQGEAPMQMPAGPSAPPLPDNDANDDDEEDEEMDTVV